MHPGSMSACQPKDAKREWRSVEGGRERKSARTWERERERKRFGSSFYMFFPPPGPALCKLGLARSAVCSTWGLHSCPCFVQRTFLWRSFVLFSRAFPFLVFLPPPFWTPFPYSNYLTGYTCNEQLKQFNRDYIFHNPTCNCGIYHLQIRLDRK